MFLNEEKTKLNYKDTVIEFSTMGNIGLKDVHTFVLECAEVIKDNSFSLILYRPIIDLLIVDNFTDIKLFDNDEVNFEFSRYLIDNKYIPEVMVVLEELNYLEAICEQVELLKRRDVLTVTTVSSLDNTFEALELLLLNLSEKVRDFDPKDLKISDLQALLSSSDFKSTLNTVNKLVGGKRTTKKKTTE